MELQSNQLALSLLFLVSSSRLLLAQNAVPPCTSCNVWNAQQTPFRIYGNTYYVGPHGLSSILVTSEAGHILIDGAIEESVPQIVANIKALGFRIEDVKLIVNSHVHFDHAGGIAELQSRSGAQVAASPWSSAVMQKSGVGEGDPQRGIIPPIGHVAQVIELHDGQVFRVGSTALTAHLTPGHTPGGTSWTWASCEGSRCLQMVYADSLTAVSADGFKFSRSPGYPNAVADFEKSFAFLDEVPCDILLTPHPDASGFWDRQEARVKGGKSGAMINPSACRQLVLNGREQLRLRLVSEGRP